MDRKERGRRAEAFLNDPLFEETIVALERNYIETWKRAGEVEDRENAHRYLEEPFREQDADILLCPLEANRKPVSEEKVCIYSFLAGNYFVSAELGFEDVPSSRLWREAVRREIKERWAPLPNPPSHHICRHCITSRVGDYDITHDFSLMYSFESQKRGSTEDKLLVLNTASNVSDVPSLHPQIQYQNGLTAIAPHRFNSIPLSNEQWGRVWVFWSSTEDQHWMMGKQPLNEFRCDFEEGRTGPQGQLSTYYECSKNVKLLDGLYLGFANVGHNRDFAVDVTGALLDFLDQYVLIEKVVETSTLESR